MEQNAKRSAIYQRGFKETCVKLFNAKTKKIEQLLSKRTVVLFEKNNCNNLNINNRVHTLRKMCVLNYLNFEGYDASFVDSISKIDKIFLNIKFGKVSQKLNVQYISITNWEMKDHYDARNETEALAWVVLRHHYQASIELSDRLFRDSLNLIRDYYIYISPQIFKSIISHVTITDDNTRALLAEFKAEMSNNLNTPKAIILLNKYLKVVKDLKSSGNDDFTHLEELIVYLGRLLGLFKHSDLDEVTEDLLKVQQQIVKSPRFISGLEVSNLLNDRKKARNNKDFSKADHICNLLKIHGIDVVDDSSKVDWKFTTTND